MKNEKWQYLKILLFFPLLICLVYVNVVGDASNYFHDINKDIAKSLLRGKAAGSNTGNDNEREIKKFLISRNGKKGGYHCHWSFSCDLCWKGSCEYRFLL